MNPWPTKPLGNVCELINGRAFKTDEWQDVGLPIIRIQNLNDPTKPFNYTTQALPEKFKVKRGDTLLSWSGTPGTSFGCFRWDGPEGWLNQHIFNVRLGEEILPAFFIHQINSKLNELIAKAHGGVGLQHITKGALSSLPIVVPPLVEQQRVVKLLDETDELHKLRTQSDRRTASLVFALFYEMFGDPVSNAKDWPVKLAGEFMAACDYGTSKKANEIGRGIPVLRMNNVTADGQLHLEQIKVVELTEGELAKQRLQAGDVLFNRTNSRELVGKTGLWDGRFEAVAASYFIRVRVRDDIEDPQHFTTFMNLPSTKRRLAEMARGAVGQANINARELRTIRVPVPPMQMQKEFTQRVAEIRKLEAEQASSGRRLKDLFRCLLYRAFRGDL
jgi:type I restriction enzyme, S subunit